MAERRDPDERVSLAGRDPEEVLRALLRVKPDDAPAEEERETGKGEKALPRRRHRKHRR